MKLVKSLLLGSAAALVATAGNAADLPSKKAAPVQYVKVCDAYGSGFFYIPGTETCIKVGGRVRADYGYTPGQTIYGTTAGITAAGVKYNSVSSVSEAQNLYGLEARARVDLDARTQTAYGTVQAVASIRLARTTGSLNDVTGLSATTASPTLEAAYIRFAGFTFGAARDNFAFMPSTAYTAGHWASFANGAKQIAYTAVLGGGFSATLAIQDATDTTAGPVNAGKYLNASGAPTTMPTAFGTPGWAYNRMPQVNARVDFDQSWGSASLMGAVGQTEAVTLTDTYNASKTVWAIGAGVKANLPMIAAGDVLYLNAAYADGMSEYTVNWTNFKSSDTKRIVGGYVVSAPSWLNTVKASGESDKVETFKSWNLAALYTHFWAPQWRSTLFGSYGKVEGTTTSRALTFGTTGAFGDMTVWNVGTQLAFLPTSNFEIGLELMYNRVEQDIRRAVGTISGSTFTATTGTFVTKEKEGNLTTKLRVERTF